MGNTHRSPYSNNKHYHYLIVLVPFSYGTQDKEGEAII